MRHPIKLGKWYPLLALLGATRSRSYVDIEDGAVTFRLGAWQMTVPDEDLEEASMAHWPWYGGIGWRMGPGTVGLIGSLDNVVKVKLSNPRKTRMMFIPVMVERLFVSLEDAEAFLDELERSKER